jgi:hypothetical protein
LEPLGVLQPQVMKICLHISNNILAILYSEYICTVGTYARFNSPEGIAISSTYGIYIADTGNHKIRKMNTIFQVFDVTTLTSSGFTDGNSDLAAFDSPAGLAFSVYGQSDYLYIADTLNCAMRRTPLSSIDVKTVAGQSSGVYCSSNDGIGTYARLKKIRGISVDIRGIIYFVEKDSVFVRRMTPDIFKVTTLAGGGSTGALVDGIGSVAR